MARGPWAEETGEGEADFEEAFEVTGAPNDPQHIWDYQSKPWIFQATVEVVDLFNSTSIMLRSFQCDHHRLLHSFEYAGQAGPETLIWKIFIR